MNAEFLVDLLLRVAWYGVVVVAGDCVNKYVEPVKLWILQHATITRDASASPRRVWRDQLGSGIVENARGPWKRPYSHFARLGAGDRVGGGGGASAVGKYYEFYKADGSGDVSSENEYINVMFWYLFFGKDTETQGQWYTLQLRICPLAMASRVLVPAFIIEVSPN